MPRKNKIIIRSGSGTPSASDFVAGEPGWDSTNGILYVRNAAGSMVAVSGGGGGGSTEIYEVATTASLPNPGTSGRIYITSDYSRCYRWDSGSSAWVEIGAVSAYDSRWDLFLPGAPTSVSGTVASGQSVVSWTAPTGVASQTPVTDYVVQYATSPFTSWTTFSDGVSTSTSATVTSLTNGVAYQFRCAAVNGAGQGPWSAASASVTPAAWSPSSLTPTLWLDASVSGSLYDATSGGSLVGSGGTVRRWEDQSGNGNHVTGSSGPTRSVSSVNSRDSLAFSSQLLTRSGLNLSSATAASLFAVIKFATSGNQIAIAFGTDASYGGLTLEANLRSAGQHSATFGNNSLASENQATGGTVSNVTKSFGAVYGSSTGTMYIGGSSAATVSRSQSLNSGSGFSVGAYFSSGYALSGNICEIVYVPRAMTAGEISSLQTYFASKWGV